jgi:hypothetical protein
MPTASPRSAIHKTASEKARLGGLARSRRPWAEYALPIVNAKSWPSKAAVIEKLRDVWEDHSDPDLDSYWPPLPEDQAIRNWLRDIGF